MALKPGWLRISSASQVEPPRGVANTKTLGKPLGLWRFVADLTRRFRVSFKGHLRFGAFELRTSS